MLRTRPRVPRDAAGRFVSWSRTVVSTPAAWHEPSHEDEVAALVRNAARVGRRVRVVGAGHSWSAIAAPDDLALSLERLTGIVAVDRERACVEVRGGTRLADLDRALAALGLALPIVGSIAQQSIAGAIATGTHGSSLVHGNLSSLVEGLSLISGRGEQIDLRPSDPRLDGARVHLGALGVVTRVTLRVEPAFQLAEMIESVPVASVAGALHAIARSAEYVKVWWFPHTPTAQVFRYARTSEPETRRPSAATLRWIDDVVINAGLFPALVALERRRTGWIPAFNRALARTYLARPRRVGASELMLRTAMPTRHRETEAALPMARAGEAFERVVRLIEREDLRVNMPVEVRFVRGDATWMSPAEGGDTCQIGAYMVSMRGIEPYFAGFWRELRALGARPHWGKELDHTADELRACYPQATRFLALRDELDPQRVFGSPLYRRILGA